MAILFTCKCGNELLAYVAPEAVACSCGKKMKQTKLSEVEVRKVERRIKRGKK